jgi:hypothetical protein
MRRASLSVAIICLSFAAQAEEKKMTGAEIIATLSNHTLGSAGDGGKSWQQIFQKSGITYYSAKGAQSQGNWDVRGDQYCSQWPPNQSWTCYDMTVDGGIFAFVSASGDKTLGIQLN